MKTIIAEMNVSKKEAIKAMNNALGIKETGVTGGIMTAVIITEDEDNTVASLLIDGTWYATNSKNIVETMTQVVDAYEEAEFKKGLEVKFKVQKSSKGREFFMIEVE